MSQSSGSPFDGLSPWSQLGSEGGLATETAEDPLLQAVARPRSVLVTGATGFVGGHLVTRLLAQGHRVRGLARRPTQAGSAPPIDWWVGDVTRPDTLRGAAEGCDVVVHLVGVADERQNPGFYAVHVEGTRNVIAEAKRAGSKRLVYASVAGARVGGPGFFRTKYEAEAAVRASEIEFVILRPSVVYGPGDQFTTVLAMLLKRLPVYPILGVGSLRLQPVSIEDVTDAMGQALVREDLANQRFELAGPERLKFAKIVRIVALALDLRRPLIQLPRQFSGPALWLVRRLGLPTPVTPEQMELFRESSLLSKSDNALRTTFRIEPLPFRVAVSDYLS